MRPLFLCLPCQIYGWRGDSYLRTQERCACNTANNRYEARVAAKKPYISGRSEQLLIDDLSKKQRGLKSARNTGLLQTILSSEERDGK